MKGLLISSLAITVFGCTTALADTIIRIAVPEGYTPEQACKEYGASLYRASSDGSTALCKVND